MKKKNFFFKNNFTFVENSLFLLFLTFPITFLLGNLLINLIIFSISLIFIISIIFKKINFDLNNKIFVLLIFFFISLLINLIFSDNYLLSYARIIKIFFIIFFIFAFKYILNNINNYQENLIYKFWSIIFTIVSIDLIIEFFTGSNLFGLTATMPGYRLGSFTGKESVIGNYFYGFVLIFLSYFYKNNPNKKFSNFALALFLIIISFLIGERSNFIKTLIIVISFSFFVYEIKLKFKILSILVLFLIAVSFLNFNQKYKLRYFTQISKIFEKDGIRQYLDSSQYGAHYKVATEIFKENPIFGVGIKNFRVESFKKKYDDLDHPFNEQRGNTHPHQIHYEFLSETGLFGYFSFLIFILFSIYYSIKSYLKTKNFYQFSGLLFVISCLLPLLPSGSFFSTYTSSIFWINYALMVGYIEPKIKN